jgi:hypothetical protein
MILPEYDACFDKREDGVPLSAIERFVYEGEPAGASAEGWRVQLAAALNEAFRMGEAKAEPAQRKPI